MVLAVGAKSECVGLVLLGKDLQEVDDGFVVREEFFIDSRLLFVGVENEQCEEIFGDEFKNGEAVRREIV